MILKLLKKEFRLCMHATNLIFLAFCCFVFIPNYPYEVAFFFSGLGVFFVSITARENGDAAFSCTLPVKRRDAALARILFCVIFQTALLLLTGAAVAVKEAFFPVRQQMNFAGSCANLALLGHGGVLLGIFNIIFFPLYFKNPDRVGLPFIAAAAAQFILIALLVVLRFAAPVYSDVLTRPDPAHLGIKAIFFACGMLIYCCLTALASYCSARIFEKTDV